jgi:flavin-dependent dehydrogenase
MTVDVAIVGGGPAGSTCATLIKKYRPDLSVLVLERELFPRDHVGESQLPAVSLILDEMGVWEKVEAAGFPIKIGATYRWGRTDELWDFEFVPGSQYNKFPRPSKFEGQRRLLAFQVDRSVYDKILLDHAAEVGAEVREGTKVQRVNREEDRITSLSLESGDEVLAKHYVDASGNVGLIRRAMDIGVNSPTHLRNVAIWDYWQNADWAVEIGEGGTRIQVMSLGYGWIWFIPISATRTSVGFVISAERFKELGKKPVDVYLDAIAAEPNIARWLKHAVREGKLASTKDWSYVADRVVGENWMLAGESSGFADPILSAGMTLAHTGAREAAYTIMELERGEHDPAWLKERFNEMQRVRLRSHIQFADFWYLGNGRFTDLRDNTSNIAREVGLELSPEDAFRWLSTGGFASETYQVAEIGTWDVTAMKLLTQWFSGMEAKWTIAQNNVFELDLAGAETVYVPVMENGKISKVKAWRRNGKFLPYHGDFLPVVRFLRQSSLAEEFVPFMQRFFGERGYDFRKYMPRMIQTLEAVVTEGWAKASFDAAKPTMPVRTPEQTELVHLNRDNPPLEELSQAVA